MALFLVSLLLVYFLSVSHLILRGNVHLPLAREYLGLTRFFAPFNSLMYVFTSCDTAPILRDRMAEIPALRLLEDNWKSMREEAEALEREARLCFGKWEPDIGFSSFQKAGWKRFYLKWYGDFLPSAVERAPKTVDFLKAVGRDVKAAAFVLLPAGSSLGIHRDPYAGSLRYHLALRAPRSDECYIDIDGLRYSWRDGEGILLDQTYAHYVKNRTRESRLILLCDVARPLRVPARWVCRLGDLVMKQAALPNSDEDPTGVAALVFAPIVKVMRRWQEWKRQIKKTEAGKRYYRLGKKGLFWLLLISIVLLSLVRLRQAWQPLE
jgi:beta-hydroxylase